MTNERYVQSLLATNAPIALSATPNRISARLNAEQTASELGFAAHDVAVLVAAKPLLPLGHLSQNGIKYFARIDVDRLATDRAWLDRTTDAVSSHWRNQNRKRTPGMAE